jgi:hypothetical protein
MTFNITTLRSMPLSIMVVCCYAVSIMPNVMFAECRILSLYAECHNAECYNAECHNAECYNAECHYVECRGTIRYNCKIFVANAP